MRLRLLLLVLLALLPALGLILLISLEQGSPLYWAGLGVAAVLGLALAWGLGSLLILHPLHLRFNRLPGLTARSPLAEALLESESRFQAVWEIAADAMALSDADGLVLAANPAYYALYGYPPEAVIGHSFAIIFPPEYRASAEAQYRVIFNSQPVGPTYETTVQRADGTERIVESRIDFITKNGRRTAMLSVIRDITDRKRAEQTLQVSEVRLRRISELVWDYAYGMKVKPDGSYEFDWITDAFTRITGYPADPAITGSNWVKIIHPDDLPLTYSLQKENVAGRPAVAEYRIVTKDGQIRWLRDYSQPVLDETGRVVHLDGAVQDITDRKLAEAARHESQRELARAQAIAHIGSYSVDYSPGNTSIWSEELYRIIGCSNQKPSFALIASLIHPDDRERVSELGRRINEEAGLPFDIEYRIIRPDGEVRWVHDQAQLDRDENGVPTRIFGTLQDITERKLAEAALRAGEERFRHVIASISDHIYVSEFMPDGQRRNRYMSPHLEALTGYPAEKFEADWEFWSTQVIHPDDRALAATQVAYLARGQDSEIEYRMVRADGRVIWVRDSAKIEVEDQTTLVYGLVSDITSRKEAEAVIRQLNEDLEQYVADRTRELTALYEISAVASKILDVETLLDETLKRVLATMTGSRQTFIHLLDETGQRLNLVASAGALPETTAQLASLPLNGDLVGWVLNQEEPLLISDTTTDPRSVGTAWRQPGDTYIGAPMRVGGHALGVLSVIGAADQQFTLDDLALLASIADQVGVTVENARLRQQAEQTAILHERERLARELHDSVTQSLYSLNLLAAAGLTMIEGEEWEAIQYNFSRIGEMAQQALKEMRLLVYELRPLDLEQEGLVGALHRRLSTVEGRAQITARLVADELPRLSSPVETALYRIAQEALNNALKHAAATAITVSLQLEGEQVVLEIADNGIGFDPDASGAHEGVGLASMAERIAPLGGTLELRSTPEAGTRVIATVPAPAQPGPNQGGLDG
ncbi:MAG: PAS domain S-box protein [Anaerolineales bacterium]|nr:PAS domain S-box protein [Anaerolineales bacterium]